MKKSVFIFALAIMAIFFTTSCNQPVPRTVTTVNTTTDNVTYSDQGFLISQQIVSKGNTVWGISKQVYGKGIMWRSIVAENPFLYNSNRMYYNDSLKMWIVIIYPGEVLKVSGQAVYPSYSYESTTTVTTTEPVQSSHVVPLWAWFLLGIVALIALLIWLFGFYMPANGNNRNSAHAQVNIINGIDLDTRRVLLERDYDIKNRTLKVIENGESKGSLENFCIETPGFIAGATFREQKKEEPKQQ
jgi:hypothetical protein